MPPLISLPRKKISSNNIKLYKSLGSIIENYRRWRRLSQETLAESIGVSVRELQNWEANRCRARMENLHDLSEVTGIPMQICVALNADQPVWYSLRERQFAYSSIEMTQLGMNTLSEHQEQAGAADIEEELVKNVQIATDKHLNLIVSCHRDIYGTEKPLERDVIKKASLVLPDLNRIIFDCWGHYVGHVVCLPIKRDTYRQIRMQKAFELCLKAEEMSDIVAQHGGVFFTYSVFWTNATVAYSALIHSNRYLAKIEQKENYSLVCYSPKTVGEEFYHNLGMREVKSASDDTRKDEEFSPEMYEIELDFLMGPSGAWGRMTEGRDKLVRAGDPIGKTSPDGPLTDDGPLIDDKTGNENETCINPQCVLYGKIGKGNIVFNGTYRRKEGAHVRRFLCKSCSKVFCSRAGSIFYDLRSSEEKVLKALALLVKGMPLRGIARVLGVKRDTVYRWLKVAAEQSGKIDAMLKDKLAVSQTELDALWSFVKRNSLRQRAILWKGSEGG